MGIVIRRKDQVIKDTRRGHWPEGTLGDFIWPPLEPWTLERVINLLERHRAWEGRDDPKLSTPRGGSASRPRVRDDATPTRKGWNQKSRLDRKPESMAKLTKEERRAAHQRGLRKRYGPPLTPEERRERINARDRAKRAEHPLPPKKPKAAKPPKEPQPKAQPKPFVPLTPEERKARHAERSRIRRQKLKEELIILRELTKSVLHEKVH